MKYPPVTVTMLIYKSADWLNFALSGLVYARNKTPFRIQVVGNDANKEVMDTGRVDIDFRNQDPTEYYLNRVYKAWNESVHSAETDLVAMINSDMYVSDYWLDELVEARLSDPKSLPCSILVESGRIPSAMPEYVKNFGTTPESFREMDWREHATRLHKAGQGKTEPGRLFMPVLVNRDEFLSIGPYPHGNVQTPEGVISGDRILFNKYAAAGFKWISCLGSVVFHTQEGEMRG